MKKRTVEKISDDWGPWPRAPLDPPLANITNITKVISDKCHVGS